MMKHYTWHLELIFFSTVFVLPGSVVLAYTLVEVASLETLKFEVFWRPVAKIVVFPPEKSRRSRSSSESDSLGNGRIKFRKHLGIKTNRFTTGSWQPFFKKEKMPWRSIPWRWKPRWIFLVSCIPGECEDQWQGTFEASKTGSSSGG